MTVCHESMASNGNDGVWVVLLLRVFSWFQWGTFLSDEGWRVENCNSGCTSSWCVCSHSGWIELTNFSVVCCGGWSCISSMSGRSAWKMLWKTGVWSWSEDTWACPIPGWMWIKGRPIHKGSHRKIRRRIMLFGGLFLHIEGETFSQFTYWSFYYSLIYGLGAMITSTVSCALEWFLTPWGSPARAIVAIPFFRMVDSTPTLKVPSPFWTM